MTVWRIEATVMPKDGVNDPQGEAIHGGLASLEFGGIREVRAGKVIVISVEASSENDAIEQGTRMCDQLLANPVIETYSISATSVETALSAGGRP